MLELSNTTRTCFDACEFKYYLRYKLHLVPIEPTSLAPYYGKAIHKSLATFYKGKQREEIMKAFGEEYAKYFVEGKDEERTISNGMIIIDEFIKRFEDDYLETVDVEVGASMLLEEEDVIYKCRIDRIAKWQGEKVVEDWKTSKYVGSSFTLIKPNNQFVGYALGVREITNTNPYFFLTLIGTKVKKRFKEGEERVEIVRDCVRFTEEDFTEFERGLINTANRVRECEKENYWPKRTHSCPSFQGCEYLPLCKSPKSSFEDIAKQFYREEKWKDFEEGGE